LREPHSSAYSFVGFVDVVALLRAAMESPRVFALPVAAAAQLLDGSALPALSSAAPQQTPSPQEIPPPPLTPESLSSRLHFPPS
jgi:hypothetical protein